MEISDLRMVQWSLADSIFTASIVPCCTRGPRDFLFLFWLLGLAVEEVLKGGDLSASVFMNLEHVGAGGRGVRLFEGGGNPIFD